LILFRLTFKVTDVFLFAIKETAQAVSRKQKTVAEKNYTKGDSPTVIFCSPSNPKGLRSSYRVIYEVKTYYEAACTDAGGLIHLFLFPNSHSQ